MAPKKEAPKKFPAEWNRSEAFSHGDVGTHHLARPDVINRLQDIIGRTKQNAIGF